MAESFEGDRATSRVLGAVLLSWLLTSVPLIVAGFALHHDAARYLVLLFIWRSLTAPFEAHVLTVIYYRLADPQRPVIEPAVLHWRSVWRGE